MLELITYCTTTVSFCGGSSLAIGMAMDFSSNKVVGGFIIYPSSCCILVYIYLNLQCGCDDPVSLHILSEKMPL